MTIDGLVLSSSDGLSFLGALDFVSDFRVELIEEVIRSGCVFLLNSFGELDIVVSVD